MIDPQKKARDADRDAAIEVVEAASTDGQITREESEARIERLLRAETVGDVQTLIRDLRRPGKERVTDAVAAVTGDAVSTAPPPRTASAKVGRGPLILVAAIITSIGLVVALTIFFSSRESSDTGLFDAGGKMDLYTSTGYAALTSAIVEKTGRAEAFSLIIHPGYAIAYLPVDATSRRTYSWYYDGDWREFGGAGTATATEKRFAVTEIDGSMFADAIAEAKAGVDEPETWYVAIRGPDNTSGCVSVNATNAFKETASIALDCEGKVLRRLTPGK